MAFNNREDTSLKTFNTAKKYAEDILFPKMDLYQQFQRQADFGSVDMNDSVALTEEVRQIQRYNGLKGMAETTYNLLINISSTVRLKGNREEIKELDILLKYTAGIKEIFYNHPERFFISEYKNGKVVDTLNYEYFDKIKNNINTCYINTEILMTRNKLLFADANDEYLSDKEILANIKEEYIG